MQITEVRLQLIEGESRLKAVASATLDREFVVHNIKVIEKTGEEGLFIAFPSKKNSEQQFVDICHPVNSRTREKFEKAILEKYEEVLNASKND